MNLLRVSVMASLIGRVEYIEGNQAGVTLLMSNGDPVLANCSREALEKRGIKEGDEFRCEIVQTDKGLVVQLERLEPLQLTPEQVAEIWKEVDFKLT